MSSTRTRIGSETDIGKDGNSSVSCDPTLGSSLGLWLVADAGRLCIKNDDGPNVLLMAGNHGDEYEGQVALTKLVQSPEPAQMRGRITIHAMPNYPTAHAGLRTSPSDGSNLNCTFPGMQTEHRRK